MIVVSFSLFFKYFSKNSNKVYSLTLWLLLQSLSICKQHTLWFYFIFSAKIILTCYLIEDNSVRHNKDVHQFRGILTGEITAVIYSLAPYWKWLSTYFTNEVIRMPFFSQSQNTSASNFTTTTTACWIHHPFPIMRSENSTNFSKKLPKWPVADEFHPIIFVKRSENSAKKICYIIPDRP